MCFESSETLRIIDSELCVDKVFHYTTASSLLGIIKHDEMFASNVAYMNDRTEFVHGLKYFSNAIVERGRSVGVQNDRLDLVPYMIESRPIPKAFSISFSESVNDLAQWRAYGGKCNGFCLGFDYTSLRANCDRKRFKLVKCIYDDELKQKVANEMSVTFWDGWDVWRNNTNATVALAAMIDPAFDVMANVCFRFKDNAFRGEKEWRAVRVLAEGEDSEIRIRESNGYLVPYVPLKMNLREPSHSRRLCIFVGPTDRTELQKTAIEWLVAQVDSGMCSVVESRIPLR